MQIADLYFSGPNSVGDFHGKSDGMLASSTEQLGILRKAAQRYVKSAIKIAQEILRNASNTALREIQKSRLRRKFYGMPGAEDEGEGRVHRRT